MLHSILRRLGLLAAGLGLAGAASAQQAAQQALPGVPVYDLGEAVKEFE